MSHYEHQDTFPKQFNSRYVNTVLSDGGGGALLTPNCVLKVFFCKCKLDKMLAELRELKEKKNLW